MAILFHNVSFDRKPIEQNKIISCVKIVVEFQMISIWGLLIGLAQGTAVENYFIGISQTGEGDF